MNLTAFAIRHRVAVGVLVLCIVASGLMAWRSLPLESSPDVDIPVVIVHAVHPGAAPRDVEALVTDVLERELEDLDDVERLTSTSAESVSSVVIEFDADVDLEAAVRAVRDRVERARADLPPDVEAPVVDEIDLSDFPMLIVNVVGGGDLVRLQRLGERLEERLEGIPGVLDVDVVGGMEREIQVLLDPQRLQHYGLGPDVVIGRIREEHRDTPAGTIELGASKLVVRVPGEYRAADALGDLTLTAPDGRPVRLRDVARVLDGFADRTSISRVDGVECVTLLVRKRSGDNIVAVTDAVRAELAAAERGLPEGVRLLVRQDQSVIVRDMVADLESSIATGLVLVLAVLFFVMGLRNASFVAIAIPLSMLATLAVLRAMGVTLNMVVLFALILALGMLVDNAIVVVENVYRHASDGVPRVEAALRGTKEVAWPVIASTATTVVAFAPLLAWPGIMGEFMWYLPLTVIIALVASLFIALVVNPVAAARFLRVKPRRAEAPREGRVVRGYRRLLAAALDRPRTVLAVTAALFVAVVGLTTRFGAGVELFPATTPDRARVTVEAPQGTVLAATDAVARAVEAIAAAGTDVDAVVTNVGFGTGGAALGAAGAAWSHTAVAEVEFVAADARQGSTWETVAALRRAVAAVEGAAVRVDVEEMGPPVGPPIAVEITGPDLAVLRDLAARASALVATVPGVVDVRDDLEEGLPELQVVVDRERAMRRGVPTAAVAGAVRTAVAGTVAAELRDGDDEVDILVRHDAPWRDAVEDVLALTVVSRGGVHVPLRDVARLDRTDGVGSVKHVGRKRAVQVSADVVGRASADALADVRAVLGGELGLPAGYGLRYAGEDEEQAKATAFLGEAFGIGLLLILLILVVQFDSLQRPLLILASVVLSLLGVLVGLLVTQTRFSVVMTGMGVVSLAGVVVNNAIVLVDYVGQLRARGMGVREALIEAGAVRLRPVLLTAVTTILGLLPMALGVGVDLLRLELVTDSTTGEWWGPLAQAVIFGLLFATVLTLVLVPVMYALQEAGSARVRAAAAAARRLGGRLAARLSRRPPAPDAA